MSKWLGSTLACLPCRGCRSMIRSLLLQEEHQVPFQQLLLSWYEFDNQHPSEEDPQPDLPETQPGYLVAYIFSVRTYLLERNWSSCISVTSESILFSSDLTQVYYQDYQILPMPYSRINRAFIQGWLDNSKRLFEMDWKMVKAKGETRGSWVYLVCRRRVHRESWVWLPTRRWWASQRSSIATSFSCTGGLHPRTLFVRCPPHVLLSPPQEGHPGPLWLPWARECWGPEWSGRPQIQPWQASVSHPCAESKQRRQSLHMLRRP